MQVASAAIRSPRGRREGLCSAILLGWFHIHLSEGSSLGSSPSESLLRTRFLHCSGLCLRCVGRWTPYLHLMLSLFHFRLSRSRFLGLFCLCLPRQWSWQRQRSRIAGLLGWDPKICALIFQVKLFPLPSPHIPFLSLKKQLCSPWQGRGGGVGREEGSVLPKESQA